MGHAEHSCQFALEFLDVRAQHKPAGVADTANGSEKLLLESLVLAIEGEQADGWQQVVVGSVQTVERCANHGSSDSVSSESTALGDMSQKAADSSSRSSRRIAPLKSIRPTKSVVASK